MGDLTSTEFGTVLLALRVIFGLVFAGHGWGKCKNGIDGTAGWFDSIGMKPGRVHALLASITEIGAGLMLAAGLLTSFAAAGVVGVMAVAGYTSHRKNGFFIVKDGWEYTFIVALIAVSIAGLGPGKWSIDSALSISDSLNGFVGLAIALVLGVGVGIAQLALFYRPPAEA
ncbi:MAG: putative oxidoreductase [Acidimicrobiales bacterium]|jgi:putative oxidoreductase